MSHDPFFASEAEELAAMERIGAWAEKLNARNYNPEIQRMLDEDARDFAEGRYRTMTLAEMRAETARMAQEEAERGTDAA